jgi:hypothetical protein
MNVRLSITSHKCTTHTSWNLEKLNCCPVGIEMHLTEALKRTQQTGLGDPAFSGSPIDVPLGSRGRMEWKLSVRLCKSRKGGLLAK